MGADMMDITEQTAKTGAHHEGKYLTFSLAGEEYGIGILKVKEIIGMMPITTVPNADERLTLSSFSVVRPISRV